MSTAKQPTAFGRISPPRHDWLARAEPETIIEPGLPIVDTHHHVWRDRGGYMLDEVLADTGSGHNVVATVFIDCRFQYRTDGPAELRSVGEVEAWRRWLPNARRSTRAKRALPPASSAMPIWPRVIASSRFWRR